MKDRNSVRQEALTAIGDLSTAGIEVSMGVGKTLISLSHMASNYRMISKFLVVAPKKAIFKTWTDEMTKFKCSYLEGHTDFSTYRSLTKQDLDYDTIYLDECHNLKYTHREWLKQFTERGGRVIGLTGTYPVYMNSEKGKMCAEFCPKVYQYKIDDAVEDNILNKYKIKVHMLSISSKQNIPVKGKFGDFNTSEMKQYKYWSDRVDNADEGSKDMELSRIQRMKALQGFNSKIKYAKALLNDQKEKAIVFTSTQDQADSICIHSFHSNNPTSDVNLQMFKEGKLMKLSAVEQLSEGVNIPNLKVGIICHSYSNNRKAAQKLGRMLRLNPDEEATVHILCYANTVDKEWVNSALKAFDTKNVEWITPIYHEGVHY